MSRAKKIFLITSLMAFAIGFSDAQENVFFWMGRPVGAILFGLFMIFTVLEKESALFDEQQRSTKSADAKSPVRAPTKSFNKGVAATPALTLAQNH